MPYTFTPLGPGAAEIRGLDLSRPLPDEIFFRVKQDYLKYPILVFRDQVLSAPQLAAFGRRFGQLESYGNPMGTAALKQTEKRETPDQMLYQSPDDPNVLIMTNEIREGLPVVGIVDNAEIWHSDGSHKLDPYQAILVHVIRNPASGGDTEFCDMRAVYDALTPQIQEMLRNQLGVHHWSKALNPRFTGTLSPAAQAEGERIAEMIPEMLQPLVRTHPETKRPSLYISPRFTLRIDGASPQLSNMILNDLFAFMEDPGFHYRHEWLPNDMMIWDNRCTNHRVRGYPSNDIRIRHRVTVAGERPY